MGCTGDEAKTSNKLIEIFLPDALFEKEDIEEIIAAAREENDVSIIKENNGHFILIMSRDTHEEIVRALEAGLLEFITDVKTNQAYVSIVDLTYNPSFTEFNIIVNKEAFEQSFDGFAAMGLGVMGMYYQMFSGIDTADIEVTVLVEDNSSGEVFEAYIYPDALYIEE